MATQTKKVPPERKSGTVWLMAVDPFGDVDLQPMWNLVKPLSRQFNATLEAVYVLAPASMNWTGVFSGPWMKKYSPLAREKLDQLLPDEKVKNTVIECEESGQRAAVMALLKYAKRVGADYLVISTHARKGLERFAMGSFAETVITLAKIPVLVLNPAHKMPREIHKILVPTDLSEKSEKYIEGLADYAQHLNAEIVLFHKQPDPLDPLIQQGVYSLGGGWVSVQSYIDEELEEKNKQIMRIENALRAKGISVSHVLDTSPAGMIESIERAAHDSGADMVSVLTQSEPWSATLLGSVARGLVRNSSLPVLVRR
ncbi:MAG: universal stress protein [Bdellovibrionales bacterium]